LAQLDSKQQALVMGHSVPMPVMIETRRYDADMWKTFGYTDLVADVSARNTALERADDF
jgi:DNA helicase HerA-like ATPase